MKPTQLLSLALVIATALTIVSGAGVLKAQAAAASSLPDAELLGGYIYDQLERSLGATFQTLPLADVSGYDGDHAVPVGLKVTIDEPSGTMLVPAILPYIEQGNGDNLGSGGACITYPSGTVCCPNANGYYVCSHPVNLIGSGGGCVTHPDGTVCCPNANGVYICGKPLS